MEEEHREEGEPGSGQRTKGVGGCRREKRKRKQKRRRGREEKDHTGHGKPQRSYAWVRARGLPGRSKGSSQK